MTTPTRTPLSDPPTVLPVIAEYIGIRAGYCGGKPHLLGHRIKVEHVAIWHHQMGMSPEEIVPTYPTLSLPEVFAALAYYHAHKVEIDADIEEGERFVEELKAKSGQSILQQKLAARNAANDPIPSG